LTIERDTLPHPLPLVDSLFLPERAGTRRSIQTLLGGVLMGGAVMLLPKTLASDAELAGARFFVGGAMSIAGIVGFVTKRPGTVFLDNVAANQALWDEWSDRLETVVEENANRLAAIRLVIEMSPPRIVELRRR
jgi:hypothetical protein